MLIDSTFYIDTLRRKLDVRYLLKAWLVGSQLWTCGVIRTEVVRRVRSPRIKTDLSNLFDVIPEVPTNEDLWRATAELAWELDQRRAVLPLTDLIIAACALQVGAPVVTLDAHFSLVPGGWKPAAACRDSVTTPGQWLQDKRLEAQTRGIGAVWWDSLASRAARPRQGFGARRNSPPAAKGLASLPAGGHPSPLATQNPLP